MANHKHKNMGNDRCECGVAVLTAKEVCIYGLKAIKMAGGDETPRFEAKITENGKVIGIVFNEGCGGCNGHHMSGDVTAFNAFIKEWNVAHGEDADTDSDLWVYEQLDNYEERKSLLRIAKKKTPFRVKGDPEGEWRTMGAPYSEQVKKSIEAKYGDKIETIFVA